MTMQRAAAVVDQGFQLLQVGKLGKAQIAAREVLKIYPDHSEANHLLGLVEHRVGHNEIALNLIRRALVGDQKNALTLGNIGIVLKDLGRASEAVETFREALNLAPEIAALHNNLGVALQALDRHDEAIPAFERAIELAPSYVEALANLAFSFISKKDYERAAIFARKAVRLNARYLRAQVALAKACVELGELKEAALALDLIQGLAADVTNLIVAGHLYVKIERLEAARNCFELALQRDKSSVDARIGLASTLSELGRASEAIAQYRYLLNVDPDRTDILRALGDAFAALGEKEQAIDAFHRQLARDPEDATTWRSLASIVRFTPDNPDADRLEQAYRAAVPASQERMHLGFAVGKVREDLGHYRAALEALLEANAIRRKDFDYDTNSTRQLVERTCERIDSSFITKHGGSGFEDRTPIFILGMPRSGTTLTEQILASHSRVHGAGELSYFKSLAFTSGLLGADEGIALPDDKSVSERLKSLGRDYVSQVRNLAPSTPHVTDKMPGNFRYVGLIHLALPQSKIIHVRRDPADNCLSIFKNFFSGDGHGYAYALAELGRYHNLYRRLMAHWREVLPEGRMFELDYEALIADQEGESRKLLAYCGLGWEDAVLEFHKADRTVKTASRAQVRQPIYKSSIRLAERYGDGLKPLLDALAEVDD